MTFPSDYVMHKVADTHNRASGRFVVKKYIIIYIYIFFFWPITSLDKNFVLTISQNISFYDFFKEYTFLKTIPLSIEAICSKQPNRVFHKMLLKELKCYEAEYLIELRYTSKPGCSGLLHLSRISCVVYVCIECACNWVDTCVCGVCVCVCVCVVWCVWCGCVCVLVCGVCVCVFVTYLLIS